METPTPKYPTLREFLVAAIAEKLSKAQIDAILDSIAEGLALSERDKAFAEYLETTGAQVPEESNTQYNLGFNAGYQQAVAELKGKRRSRS